VQKFKAQPSLLPSLLFWNLKEVGGSSAKSVMSVVNGSPFSGITQRVTVAQSTFVQSAKEK
jgi:hypothetical protein